MNTSVLRLLSLRRDQQDPEQIDAALRDGAKAVGTNLWVLFFAMLIASVGLNVNSTAVIIGAMLISPLMGPIVGIGYGAAVLDFPLIRSAAANLALFAILSVLTSAAYFAVSPLDQPQSELLARTSPTLWDVLIATFGGAAGMVAATRRSFTNIGPGVAIATALMPPLCTVGFGLAHARWDMFAGALYLFTINAVFIAASTLAMAKLLRLPVRGEVDPQVRARHRMFIGVGLMVVLVPSIWLGWRFVGHEVFERAAREVSQSLARDGHIVGYEVDTDARTLRLTAIGRQAQADLEVQAKPLLEQAGAHDARVLVRTTGEAPADVAALKQDIGRQFADDVNRRLLARVQRFEERLDGMELAAASAAARLQVPDVGALLPEIQALVPSVRAAGVAWDVSAPVATGGSPTPASTVVVLTVARPLSTADRGRLERWLNVRLARGEVRVVEQIARAPTRS